MVKVLVVVDVPEGYRPISANLLRESDATTICVQTDRTPLVPAPGGERITEESSVLREIGGDFAECLERFTPHEAMMVAISMIHGIFARTAEADVMPLGGNMFVALRQVVMSRLDVELPSGQGTTGGQ
jgi:hypothetical protein